MQSGIYQILNLVNQKRYIGSSVNVPKRWATHRRMLLNNEHDNEKLQRAFNKYGEDCFSFSIVETSEENDLLDRENHFINAFDAVSNGYNICPVAGASMKGRHHTPEARAKIAAYQNGIKRSDDTKAKMSKAQKGKIVSDESRANMSLAKTGRVISEETKLKLSQALKGRIFAKETRDKISLANTGRRPSEETRAKLKEARNRRPPISEETRAKMSSSQLNRYIEPSMIQEN